MTESTNMKQKRHRVRIRRVLLVSLIAVYISSALRIQKLWRIQRTYNPRVLQKFTKSKGGTGDIRSAAVVGAATTTKNNKTEKKWATSTILPDWMKDYFEWHHQQRLLLNESNWASYQYLVISCLAEWNICGGTSDRLQLIPYAIRVAAAVSASTNNTARRILFIKWERPAPLEEFLVPPEGGLNWSIPAWLVSKIPRSDHHTIDKALEVLEQYKRPDGNTIKREICGPQHYYNDYKDRDEASYEQVYKKVWSMVFEPSPPVARLVEKTKKELQLETGNYVATHIRSMYRDDQSNNLDMVQNSIKCTLHHLQPGQAIYVASDSWNATQHAVDYGQSKGATIVARTYDGQPMVHIDLGTDWLETLPERLQRVADVTPYYSTFVDLYMLAGSRCVTYGRGCYGRWGWLLSNVSCGGRC